MKREPLKVGDRVSVEGFDFSGKWRNEKGSIVKFILGSASINPGTGAEFYQIGIRSLRRLVKRERRTVTLFRNKEGATIWHDLSAALELGETVVFREVRGKK